VGYEEGGVLTEKVKRNPYSVILLDEIEKAHPDIFNLFLQVLEDGFLTDNKGKRINFRNTIIIMTTNVGIRKKSAKGSMGFGSINKELEQENFKEKLQEFLRPEFLNRIDKILVFNSLNKRDLAKIIKLELDQLRQTLSRQNLKFEWEDKVVNNILDKCREEGQGARIIRDIIREQVENTLADKIININNKQTLLSVRVNKEKIVIK